MHAYSTVTMLTMFLYKSRRISNFSSSKILFLMTYACRSKRTKLWNFWFDKDLIKSLVFEVSIDCKINNNNNNNIIQENNFTCFIFVNLRLIDFHCLISFLFNHLSVSRRIHDGVKLFANVEGRELNGAKITLIQYI